MNKAPVIISCESPSTAIFEKFAANGVKDIFQSRDLNRLALIAKREIEAYQASKELAELKKRFTESENRYHNLLYSSD